MLSAILGLDTSSGRRPTSAHDFIKGTPPDEIVARLRAATAGG